MKAMHNRRLLFALAVFVASSAGAAGATGFATLSGGAKGNTPFDFERNDSIIWDNGAIAPGASSTQIDSVYPFDSQVADDFTLRDQLPAGDFDVVVTGVQWGGTYWSGVPGNPHQGFNILFYADAGGMPTGAGPVDPSPTALLSQFIPFADSNETPTGNTNEYFYNAKLSIPFLADPDITYWLGIQSVMVSEPDWGWNASAGGVLGNPSVQGFPLLGINYWDNVLADQSFQLTGFYPPEPNSLALLAMGSMVMLHRRRHSRSIVGRS